MTHVGRQIVDAFELAVKAAGSECSGHVSQRRFFPQSETVDADAIIHSGDEDISRETQGSEILQREMAIVVAGRLRGEAEQLEARGWAFQETIEQAIYARGDFDGKVLIAFPRATSTEISGTGDRPLLIRTIEFAVIYWTRNGVPETAL